MAKEVTATVKLITREDLDLEEIHEVISGLLGILTFGGIVVEDITVKLTQPTQPTQPTPRWGKSR
jgi:hypothetical protein